MPAKIFDLPNLGQIKLYKRRGTRNLRITLTPKGEVRVTMPIWVPYRLGLEFARNRAAWIIKNRNAPQLLRPNQAIGKAHHVEFRSSLTTTRPVSRLVANTLRVSYPANLDLDHPKVQQAANRGAVKALFKEAEALLPGRLESLAQQHGFTYRSVRFANLRSKWGSCTHKGEITLNVFLMTLPWDLIDYVLLHELTHTKVLRHGQPFWTELGKYAPDLAILRKNIRKYHPAFS